MSRNYTNWPGYIVAVCFLLVVLGIFGWGMNIYKLIGNDFEAPYKSEVVRVIGIPVPIIGAFTGYMTIGDEEE